MTETVTKKFHERTVRVWMHDCKILRDKNFWIKRSISWKKLAKLYKKELEYSDEQKKEKKS